MSICPGRCWWSLEGSFDGLRCVEPKTASPCLSSPKKKNGIQAGFFEQDLAPEHRFQKVFANKLLHRPFPAKKLPSYSQAISRIFSHNLLPSPNPNRTVT